MRKVLPLFVVCLVAGLVGAIETGKLVVPDAGVPATAANKQFVTDSTNALAGVLRAETIIATNDLNTAIQADIVAATNNSLFVGSPYDELGQTFNATNASVWLEGSVNGTNSIFFPHSNGTNYHLRIE